MKAVHAYFFRVTQANPRLVGINPHSTGGLVQRFGRLTDIVSSLFILFLLLLCTMLPFYHSSCKHPFESSERELLWVERGGVLVVACVSTETASAPVHLLGFWWATEDGFAQTPTPSHSAVTNTSAAWFKAQFFSTARKWAEYIAHTKLLLFPQARHIPL